MSLCRYNTDEPCENHGTSSRTCIDCILNKIESEIVDIQLIGYATVNGKREIASRAVLQIIDKYKRK